MTRHDPEIGELRDQVHCALVLERRPPCSKLDRKEITKLSVKYRRGKARSSSSAMPGAIIDTKDIGASPPKPNPL